MEKEKQQGVRKGAWTHEEDALLRRCIEKYGEGKWNQVPTRAGLRRCRKSCRLRWMNYLRPDIKRGEFSEEEVDLILRLHKLLGNRWSLIAGRIPGRTANDIKNHWNAHLSKKLAKKKDMGSSKIKVNSKKPKEAFTVYKPQPRTLTISRTWSKEQLRQNNGNCDQSASSLPNAPYQSIQYKKGLQEGGTGNSNESFWMNVMSGSVEAGGVLGVDALGMDDCMFSYADLCSFLGLELCNGD